MFLQRQSGRTLRCLYFWWEGNPAHFFVWSGHLLYRNTFPCLCSFINRWFLNWETPLLWQMVTTWQNMDFSRRGASALTQIVDGMKADERHPRCWPMLLECFHCTLWELMAQLLAQILFYIFGCCQHFSVYQYPTKLVDLRDKLSTLDTVLRTTDPGQCNQTKIFRWSGWMTACPMYRQKADSEWHFWSQQLSAVCKACICTQQ